MASSSSSSSSERLCKYDVFLNFRGEDTRKIFVGHLHKALKQRELNTFIDSENVGKGNDLSVLLKAITDSKLSIVVFSQDYASSTWCLKELVQIMECSATQKQIVVPIFYQLDPSHVRKQEARFAQAFVKHESNRDLQEVQSWRSALTQAANFSGWDSRDYKDDAKLIDAIAVDVFNKLIHIRSSEVNDDLVGMDAHMHNMRRLLSLSGGTSDVVYVGIWGMGGIGKTTIAKAVYNNMARLFEHRCFLDNVRERFTGKDTVQMQVEFLSAILNEKVNNLDGDYMMMMERLGDRKILVVLDDVDDSNQIDTLLGMKRSFGGGSKIIVTTRDEHVLQPRDEFKIYKPKPLSYPVGLKLFSQYAFKTNKPSEEYDHLSRRALEYAQGLPLALRILGSHLCNKSVSVWKDELEKIKKIPNSGIQRVLRTSYDGLDDSEQNIFLDIACFFKGMHKDYVTKVLNSCGFFASCGLSVLVDRALVTISKFGGIEMHDLLQEMGREIIHNESPKKPWKRSRLWSYEDVRDVLTQNKATKVEGIIVELSNSGELSNSEDINLNAEGFVSMTNLRLLIITFPQYLNQFDAPFEKCFEGESWPEQSYVSYQSNNCNLHLNGDLKFLSHKLRFLVWHGYPLKSLPSNFDPKNLVDLDMRYSHMEQLWIGTKRIKELISINLSCCKYLKEIPLCTVATKLEKLILDGCISLLEVHPSISALEKLVFLSLKWCTELKILPSSIHHLKSLKFLDLRGCSNLEIFPEISEDMEALSELKLGGTAIKKLPSSIERLRRLKSLSMQNCTSLVCLPDSICNLADLKYLYLSGCSKLHNLPENFGSLESLLELELHNSGIEQLPVSILRLKLGKLSFNGCKQMKAPLSSWRSSSIEGHCTAVVYIDLRNSNLLELSDAIAHFSSLKILELSRTNLESLPATMNQLDFLELLELEGCKRLKSIPELSSSISYINANNCTALETVSTPKCSYDMDRCFTFYNCHQLVQNDLFRDIVETHSPPQGNYSRPFYMCFPGSEIPERFIHQCKGSSVIAQLPPNWFDNKFLGFAICAVTNKFCMLRYIRSAQCFCTFKGNHCEYRFSCYLYDPLYTFSYHGENVQYQDTYNTIPIRRLLGSNHMFLGYLPWSEFGINGEEVNERCYTEAKFEIQLLRGNSPGTFGSCIESCGVQFFFANNEEVANQDFESSLEGCSAEPSGSDIASVDNDQIQDEEQYLKLSKLFGGANRNIEDNGSSGKREILSMWTQQVRVTSGLMQGKLDDGFSWNENHTRVTRNRIKSYISIKFENNYTCQASCETQQFSLLRFFIDDPTTLDITYVGRHPYWKTLPMSTHQVRLTPDMGLEGPFDGFSWRKYGHSRMLEGPFDGFSWRKYVPSIVVYYVCTPQNVQGCTAVKEVQYANEDQTILKITYRGRHTCTQASTISIGGRGDSRISEGGDALRTHDQVVQSPTSLGANGGGGNVIRLADKVVDDGNVNMLPDTNLQDLNVNDMANNDMVVYGVPSEGTSDAVVNQLEEEDAMDFEKALDFNSSLKKRKREMMDSDDDQPNESNSISNNNR